jgi:hypothetical protein
MPSMKRFDEFYRINESLELQESSMPGGIKNELNKLQLWWNDNHVSLNLWDPKDPKKVRLYPIINPPFDVIRTGGIAVIGENPGAAGGQGNVFDKAVTAAMKKTGGMPPVWDEKKGGWFYSMDYRNSGQNNVRRKRYSNKEEEKELSAFLTKDWWSKNKKKSGLSEIGAHYYHAALNKMVDDMVEISSPEDASVINKYRNKMMHTNFIPFNSNNADMESKSQVINASVPWIKSYIKTVKPQMIVTTLNMFGIMKRKLGMKVAKDGLIVYASPSSQAEKDAGLSQDNPSVTIDGKKKSLQRYYLTGDYNGIPVVAFTHWTGSKKGGPLKATWKDKDNVELIASDFARLLKQGPASTLEVDWDEEKSKVTPHKKRKSEPKTNGPTKAILDPRLDKFEELNADRIGDMSSKDEKAYKVDKNKLSYDDLLANWAVPGKLKRPA